MAGFPARRQRPPREQGDGAVRARQGQAGAALCLKRGVCLGVHPRRSQLPSSVQRTVTALASYKTKPTGESMLGISRLLLRQVCFCLFIVVVVVCVCILVYEEDVQLLISIKKKYLQQLWKGLTSNVQITKKRKKKKTPLLTLQTCFDNSKKNFKKLR